MTLEEIEDSLPNGLHDAHLISISLDYLKREAKFGLEISFSEPDDKGPEIYRTATLSLSQFLYCVIEAPHSSYPYQEGKALRVDAGPEEVDQVSSTGLPGSLPEAAFAYRFFVNNWNSFIHVAALDAELRLH